MSFRSYLFTIFVLLIAVSAWSGTIRWAPASGNPDGYILQKSVNGGDFETIADVLPEVTEVEHPIGSGEVAIFRVGSKAGETVIWSEESDVTVGNPVTKPTTEVPSAPGRPVIIIVN